MIGAWWRRLRYRASTPGWTDGLDGGDVHILPIRDTREHGADDCWCAPAVEPVPRPDGSYGWLYTHNSADGRERYE